MKSKQVFAKFIINFANLFHRQNSSKSSSKNIVPGRKYEAEYKKRDAQYTRASVVMVMAFIVCNTPRFIPNVMEIFVELDQWPQVRCFVKVENILKGSLDQISSPSVKIQIIGGKVCLRCKGKTLLGVVNKLLKTKSLLTSPSNVLPYYLK